MPSENALLQLLDFGADLAELFDDPVQRQARQFGQPVLPFMQGLTSRDRHAHATMPRKGKLSNRECEARGEFFRLADEDLHCLDHRPKAFLTE
jgi:hypothetical protein